MKFPYDFFKILKDWVIPIRKDNDRFVKYWGIIEGREAVNRTGRDILLDGILKKKAGI
jgi:hypothetical protein